MTKRSKNFKKYSRRWAGGLTLIEVVAGTAILGTLLVSVIVANARLTKLASRSSMRVEACKIADDLLEQWWADKENLPRNDEGYVEGHEGWKWRTHVAEVADESPEEALKAEIVVVEIFAPDNSDDTTPAVSLEILLTKKPERTDDALARHDTY